MYYKVLLEHDTEELEEMFIHNDMKLIRQVAQAYKQQGFIPYIKSISDKSIHLYKVLTAKRKNYYNDKIVLQPIFHTSKVN